jgi:hypothetical protein
MSAFIISTATMQRVVDAIDKTGRPFCGMSTSDSAALDKIGARLFKLNAAAVNARYPSEPQKAPRFRYRPLGQVQDYEHYRALSCLLYQCSEGNVPNTQLYRAVNDLARSIASDIAERVARNCGAPWDWPEER